MVKIWTYKNIYICFFFENIFYKINSSDILIQFSLSIRKGRPMQIELWQISIIFPSFSLSLIIFHLLKLLSYIKQEWRYHKQMKAFQYSNLNKLSKTNKMTFYYKFIITKLDRNFNTISNSHKITRLNHVIIERFTNKRDQNKCSD